MFQSKQKVLIVDDNPENIRLAASSLQQIDVSLAFATDGFKALTSLKNEDIDLVLMDVNMPEMDGFETLKTMKGYPSMASIPVIFITANNDHDSIVKAFAHGGVDYITKPFNPEELRARVETHLKLRRFNQNLEKVIGEMAEELQESLITDQSTQVYNASKLSLDLSSHTETCLGTMLHIRNIQQLELAYGLDAVEGFLAHLIQWVEENRDLPAKTYRVSFGDFICLFETQDVQQADQCCRNLQEKLRSWECEIIPDSLAAANTMITLAEGVGKELVRNLRVAQLEALSKNLSFLHFHEGGMQILKQQEKNLQWMRRLQKSFDHNTLVPFYQPIIDATTQEVVRYECLARIIEGEEIITPWYFIEAAKQLGAITEVTKRIIKQACQTFSGSSKGFSINITGEDLFEGYLSAMLQEMTATYDIAPSQILLEVLEEVSVFGSDQVLEELLGLKRQGYRIALDDFGSEKASFSRMMDLEIDLVKVDGMFIRNIHTDQKSYKIVQGIVQMARSLEYDIVAEFVHCQEVADTVKSMGIRFLQGYFYGMPNKLPKEL